MNFKLGQRISAYDEEGLPCRGKISGFDGEDTSLGPMAIIRLELKDREGKAQYERIRLNTAHPIPVDFACHRKETFLAAASRCGPVLYFKDEKARRDYLEVLWNELCLFSVEEV
jgi:hypothetical protein